MPQSTPIAKHQSKGRFFRAGGTQSFVREEGEGEPIVCLHGVPSSSFLYRKMLPELANQGFKGIAFDFPGMGLADRPEQFDYSWTGLGKWTIEATEALGLSKFHLVIHDIGGPIGMELVAAHPERILSLTILNTIIVKLPQFKKPWTMRPFEWRGIGEMYLQTIRPALFRPLMFLQGVKNKAALPKNDAKAYVELLKREDKGRAFLKIMRGFEPSQAKENLYKKGIDALKQTETPIQIIWGANDPALTIKKYGFPTRDLLGIERFITLPAKHFLQEDQAPEIASFIMSLNDIAVIGE